MAGKSLTIDWMKTKPTTQFQKKKSFIQELKILKTVLNWYKNFLNEDFNVPIKEKHKQLFILRLKTLRGPDYFIQPEDVKKMGGKDLVPAEGVCLKNKKNFK